jgi:TonB-linked SusC/RagA family outer membrane protein
MKFFGKGHVLPWPSSYHQMILAMKLTAILLTAAFLNVHAGAYSQNVTLSCNGAPLKKVFSEIKKQTGYSFFYNYELLKNAKSVTMEVKNIPLQDVLSLCFSDQPLDYYIQNKTVFVTDRPLTPPAIGALAADTAAPDRRIIDGKVVDEKGKPLENVTVFVKGTNRAVATTVEGEFRIKEAPGAVLVVSRVGYAAQQVKLGNVSTIAITLQTRSEALGDVEVTYNTGYQNVAKERATGSFVQISGEELNRQVGPNALQKMFTITSGMLYNPNALNKVAIRGLSTINAISNPLIVVDNFPYEGTGPQGDIQGLLEELNPNDIASVTVLKDAAAASIWGIRAANGVIVITTKKGSFNKRPSVGFSSNVTVGGKPNLNYIKSMSSSDEIAFEQLEFSKGYYNAYDDSYPGFNSFPSLPQVAELLLAVRRGAITQAQADAQIAVYGHHNVKDDISKYILQKTVAQQHLVNFSGGNQNYNYYASVGYDQATGSSKGDANNRYTLNFNNTYRPVQNLELTGFLSYTQDKLWENSVPYGSFLPLGSYTTPYAMLADAQGSPLSIPYQYRTAFVDTAKSAGLLDWHYRPLAEQKFMDHILNEYHVHLGGIAKYTILNGLSATVNYQYEKLLASNYNDQSDSLYSVRNTINNMVLRNPPAGTLPNQIPVGNIYTFSNGNQTIWGLRGTLNFNRTFGDHGVDVIAGGERRQNSSTSNSGTLYGYDPVNGTSKPVNSAANLTNYFGYQSSIGGVTGIGGGVSRYGSYFANGAYTYKGRYTVSASGREDQSNFFGVKANQRIQPLWSAGAAWNLSKEVFYKVSWLPYLRLRATYGFNGNLPTQAVGGSGTTAYPTASYSTGTIVSASLPYATVTSPNNPQLSFEKVKVINLAVEASSKNRRIGGSFEYYFKKGTDLIGPIQTDPTTGWLQFNSNNADIKGHGFDLTLNTRNIEGRDFKWHTDLNLSFNTDKVTSYKLPINSISTYFVDNAVVVGRSLYKIFAYRSAGLDPATGDPRIYIGGKPSSYTNYNTAKLSDLKYVGSDIPHYYGSMINTFIYKRWSLSANLYYKFNWYFRRPSMNYSSLFYGWGGSADYAKRWQKPGDELITNVPSLPSSANSNRDQVYQNSDVLVAKGDYIRLQDVRLNYDLSKGATHRWPFQSTQVFLYMNNVGIIWKANHYGIDPDFYSLSSTPNPRTISAGVNVNF